MKRRKPFSKRHPRIMAATSGVMHVVYVGTAVALGACFWYGNTRLMVGIAPACWIAAHWINEFCPASIFACRDPEMTRKPGVIYID